MYLEAVKVHLSWSLLLKCTLLRMNYCSCPKWRLSPSEICSDAENKSRFRALLPPPDVELDSKGKGDFEGVGGKGEADGGERIDSKRGSRQACSITVQCQKVRQKHKNISGQQQNWAKCAVCLSDVVVVDGFLITPSCFSKITFLI